MPSQTLLVEIFGPLAIAFVLFVIVSGVRRLLSSSKPLSPAEIAAARESFRSRLIHPKVSEVEQGIGGLIPERLLSFYGDHPSLLIEGIEIHRPGGAQDAPSEWIESFLPMDMESQKLTVDLASLGWGKGFCFATDGAGNFYWVPVADTRQHDAPVNYACHDPLGNQQVASSLDEFLSWPRVTDVQD